MFNLKHWKLIDTNNKTGNLLFPVREVYLHYTKSRLMEVCFHSSSFGGIVKFVLCKQTSIKNEFERTNTRQIKL